MWIWLTATAKAHATPQTIAAKRRQWVAQGKDQELNAKCRAAQRYVVADRTPPTVFWLLDTDTPAVTKLITEHFGDLWDIQVAYVTPQGIGQAA